MEFCYTQKFTVWIVDETSSPTLTWPHLRHNPFNSWSRKHFMPPPTLCTIQMILLFPYLVQPVLTSVHPHPPLIHVDCWLPMFPMCAPLSLWPAMWCFHPWAPVYKHAYNLHLQVKSIPPLLDPGGNPYPHYPHSTHTPSCWKPLPFMRLGVMIPPYGLIFLCFLFWFSPYSHYRLPHHDSFLLTCTIHTWLILG